MYFVLNFSGEVKIMENRIVIIDGNSLINRAYYAVQRPMITKDGIYTQGIYGFVNMLNKIETDYESGYMAVAFDMKAPTFRHKEYPEYKAGRKKMPAELAMQLPLLKDVLSAMNIKILEKEGYEADDIIGTLAKRAEANGMESVIITGDKDELQLATEKTKVVITRRGVSEFEVYDREYFIKKYDFAPEFFVDFKGMMGDQSDNIPGIPGVGEKTALKFMKEYGTLENFLDHREDLKGKMKEKVCENVDVAVMSKRLATIDTDVPMSVDFEEYKLEEPDYERLVQIYVKLEFNSLLKKIGARKPKDSAYEYKPLKINRHIIKEVDDIEALKAHIGRNAFVVLKIFGDGNHLAKPILTGASILVGKEYYYVSFEKIEVIDALINVLNEIKPEIIGHDIKKDYYMLKHYGLKHCKTGFDTAIAQYVIDSSRSNYSISVLGEEYFRESISEEETFLENGGQLNLFDDRTAEYSEYGFKWCAIVAQMTLIQKTRLEDEKLDKVFYQVELPLIEVMADMEYAGFAVDRKNLEEAGDIIKEKIKTLTENIYDLAGEEFNIKSPKQLGVILFDKLGLTPGKKTKSGYSTNAEVLEKIREEHEIIDLISEYRSLVKLTGTYIDGLIPLISADSRIHCNFNQTVTSTGRISSSEPNMQNIPIRTQPGRSLRKAFVPKKGYVLIGADYSQIELRVLAHMSRDKALIESFNNGEDIHKATAAGVLGIPENEVTPEQRSRAKAVNFGIIYGMSAFGLSTEIHVSRKEAEEYINNYFNRHEAVKNFMQEQVRFCKEKGFVRTILGRKRNISEVTASNYTVRQLGERLAMNTPIQGSAADIIKIAMVKVHEALKPFESELVLQVHDELIIETKKSELDTVKKLLTESMENAIKLSVKLAVDLEEGSNWYELK